MPHENSKHPLLLDRRASSVCAALVLVFLMLPSTILYSNQASISESHHIMASSGIIEDHIVKRFNTTITVIDEKTVHVSIDYGFTWLNSNYSRDMWYVYVGTDAYGIITEDEKGPLNYSTNYSIENGWAPVRLREGVNAGQSCYFKVSYYAENYITPAGQGQSQQKQYRLGMWAVWDNARKEDVAIKVNFPSWFSISSYDLSFLKAGTTQDGGTVLTARMQNVSYDTNYYLGVDLITKQDTSGWRYVPNVIVFNWTRSIMAEVPASLILAVNNLGNGTAYLTNTTVSAPAILNLRGNSINEIGKLRPFETRYLYFTVNASSAGASYIFTTIAYNYGNGTVRIQKSNCTVDVTRHMYESVVACNIEPDSAEISKETSLNYVMVPIRNASISVSLIRPDGSVFSKVSRNVTYGSFTIRFAPDVAGNWTANLEVPEISSYRSARMNTIFLVHSTNFYSSRILSSDNKKLVASYDVKEVYTFTNNGTETEQSPTFDVSLYVTLPTQDVTLLDMNPLPINLSYNYSGLRAKFSTPELDPEENFTIVVRFNVKLLALPPVIDDFNGTLGEIPTEFLKYTGYAKYWETNDTSIQNLSSSLTANQTTVLGKARAIYLWIADNIKYDSDKLNAIERGEPTEQYTAPQTLALRKGICEDISNLFITLCRASGIPAIGIGGNPYNGVNGSDNIKSSHAWSAAYIPGYGWIEVDATWKQFGRLDYVHVARSSGRDTPGAGGYYWWGINNATVYDEHLYMTRMSTTVGDNTYQSINELDTNLLIGIFIIVAIITAVATVPFIIMKKRRDRRYSSI